MNWTKKLSVAAMLNISAICLSASPRAAAQNTTAKADTTMATTTVRVDLSIDELTRIVQAAAEAIGRNSEQLKSAMTAAADSTAKTGAEALREVLSIGTDAAMDILSQISNVADSVATANKAKVEAAKVAAEAKAAQAGKMVAEGAQTLAEMATNMTQAQADSLKRALMNTRKALDAAIKDMEERRQR